MIRLHNHEGATENVKLFPSNDGAAGSVLHDSIHSNVTKEKRNLSREKFFFSFCLRDIGVCGFDQSEGKLV